MSADTQLRDEQVITRELRRAGVDARCQDGWVYVALPNGRMLCIASTWGEPLSAEVYESRPAWFYDGECVSP